MHFSERRWVCCCGFVAQSGTWQVGRMGSGALAIALPFACILGLLAAVIASNVGKIQSLQNPTNCCSYCFCRNPPGIVSVSCSMLKNLAHILNCSTLWLRCTLGNMCSRETFNLVLCHLSVWTHHLLCSLVL